jgi:cytochrome c oxidase subunit 3
MILFIVSQKMFFLAFFHSSLILLPIKILGFHVFVGAIALFVTLVRVVFNHLTGTPFWVRIWYWHFVDVVWLFLPVTLYWWGW